MTLDKPWLNASLAVDARVTLLLAAMTLDEKVAQLYVVDGGEYTFFGGGCVANPALSDAPYAGDACTYDSVATGAKTAIGEAGRLYGVYL